MGMHLCVVNRADPEDRVRWWDDTRTEGDRAFDGWRFAEADAVTYADTPDPEESYWRPADFDAAEAWVRGHLGEGGQDRLLGALRRMRADPSLWFYSSY